MIEEIKKYDIEFNEATFLSKVDHMFIMILDAIMNNNIDKVKHYLNEDIYEELNTLVNEYKEKNIARLFDEMNIKTSNISNVNIIDNKIVIEVNITTRYMDYFIDDDGNYISGINDHRIEKNHILKLSKPINSSNLKEARRCNHCGRTLDINDSGICPYCNQVIDISNNEYIITSISGI